MSKQGQKPFKWRHFEAAIILAFAIVFATQPEKEVV
jgi:hypothetical protein